MQFKTIIKILWHILPLTMISIIVLFSIAVTFSTVDIRVFEEIAEFKSYNLHFKNVIKIKNNEDYFPWSI